MRYGCWRRRGVIAALVAGAFAAPAFAATAPLILVVGDSLSAEYGLKRGAGWVALMEQRLAQEKIAARVVNASISGDTTSGGRSRLPALLARHKPDYVVIELGANDALRGLPLAGTEDNLAQMAQAARKAGARVLLVGMQVPPNMGTDYATRFGAIFPKVAREYGAGLVPFMLHGVANVPEARSLFQGDGLHPLAEAHPRILENIWPQVKKLLSDAQPAQAARKPKAGP
jgi:acyl-CoA thioesterase-1